MHFNGSLRHQRAFIRLWSSLKTKQIALQKLRDHAGNVRTQTRLAVVCSEKGIYERSKTSEMNETLVNETKEPSRE